MSTMHWKRRSYLAALVGILSAPGAVAQQQAASDAPRLEEVEVTGTRLRGAVAPVGSTVISLDREYIERSSAVSLDKLVQETPQIFDLGVSEGSRGQAGGSGNIVYGNAINLRGIGPFSTLVLLDGHRAVTNGRNIEPSIIPTLALERLEVVPDGASAIYGSDAIAGVVNMVLRRNVDGGKVTVQYGVGDDYEENRLGAAWGTTWESGQFFGAIEKAHRSNLNGLDRDFFTSNQRGADYRTNQCNPGNIIANGTSYAIPPGGVMPGTAGSLVPGSENLCEAQLGQDLLPEQDYESAAFTFNQRLTDRIEFLADGFWSQRDFKRLPPYERGILQVPSSNAFFVDPTGTGLSSVAVPYNFNKDFARDVAEGFSRSWELTGGFKFELPADWRLEVLATYGENRIVSESFHGIDSRDLNAALASSDPATAFDPFGGNRTSQSVRDRITDQIYLIDTTSDFTGSEIRLDGPLFALPGGDVLLAAGYEYQEIDYLPRMARGNPGTPYGCVQCDIAGSSSLKREVDSYYAELLVPIVGSSNRIPGIESLQLKAAVRHDKYSDVGNTTNPQFGIDWQPIESLRVRASYGESFRAPLITDLYGNSSAMFVELFPDPELGGAPRVGVFQSGGNLDLEPETATTKTLGFDWQPEQLPGASLSLTWFDIEYEKQIAAYLGDNNILNREDAFAGAGIILRDAAAAARVDELFAQGLTVARGVLPAQVTLFVDGRPNNLGVSRMKGLDFLLSYGWESTAGSWLFSLNGMYVDHYEVALTAAGAMEDRRNTIFHPNRIRMRASLAWERNNYGARVVFNHIGSYTNNLVEPSETVESYQPVDLSAWIDLGRDERGWAGGWLLSMELRNAFDEDPPYVNIAPTNNGSGGYDAAAASPIGRVLSMSISKSF